MRRSDAYNVLIISAYEVKTLRQTIQCTSVYNNEQKYRGGKRRTNTSNANVNAHTDNKKRNIPINADDNNDDNNDEHE